MIIDDKRKIIFCHVEKTAGSSITTSFWPEYKRDSEFEPVNYEGKHASMVSSSKYNNYYKFAFVRNPYDRALSKYFHHRRIKGAFPPFERAAKELSFNDWVSQGGLSLFRPQTQLLYKEKNLLCNFVGRFETLHEDIQKVSKICNINATLLHLNKGLPRESFINYYNDNSLDYVWSKYKDDFINFNYEKI
jgi:hypothetical protein